MSVNAMCGDMAWIKIKGGVEGPKSGPKVDQIEVWCVVD